ncbi:hypothetical protein BpHYR1_011659 [Brachionus plicatilis]|uniref:Uncharacterized protein n=1 Tax=Brachionus plicatilis TaxID=10195 RepID=A0A3M7S7C6_BRAPC|nr:hypothetical protein BpHYR1_011659 [Brachionus plicatilis]
MYYLLIRIKGKFYNCPLAYLNKLTHVTPKEATVPAKTKVTKNLSPVVFHHIGIPSSAYKKLELN